MFFKEVMFVNRKIYWIVLWNPAFLCLYGYGLSVVCDFCKYGNVSKRLPVIAGVFLAGVLWFLAWTVAYFLLKKKKGKSKTGRWAYAVLAAEFAALLFLTGWSGKKIYAAAQPYSGKLGSYLRDLKTKKTVSLKDSERDFAENGLDGILAELSAHCGLDTDWDLYTANMLTLRVDENGTIQTLEAFLYAFDEDGDFRSWLISYDAGKDADMTVYLDGSADTTYKEQEQMKPFFLMTDELRQSVLLTSLLSEAGDGETLTFKYSGYSSGISAGASGVSENWYVVAEGDTDTGYSMRGYSASADGAVKEGFLLNIYLGEDCAATIAMELGTMETAADLKEQEEMEAQIKAGALIADGDNMTFYLDEDTPMSLIVTDAALGSRFYAFQNGSVYNEDPFGGNIGVAESIYFLDEFVGFILLTDAARDSSDMYYTGDGGVTFTKVELPVGDGEAYLAGNEFDYTSADMDYIYTPYEEDGCLYAVVSYDDSGASYLSLMFVSEDKGQSWVYSPDGSVKK